MSKIKLFVAQSEDGFIADSTGGVQFVGSAMADKPTAQRGREKYNEFYENIDVVIQGANIYRQMTMDKNNHYFGFWPFSSKITFVFTNNKNEKALEGEAIKFVSGDINEAVNKIKELSRKDICLMGGANIVKQFHDAGLIDEYLVTTIPAKLGEGIELFKTSIRLSELQQIDEEKYGVSVERIYVKKVD